LILKNLALHWYLVTEWKLRNLNNTVIIQHRKMEKRGERVMEGDDSIKRAILNILS